MHLVKLIGADGKILDQVALVQSTSIALLLLNVISKKRVQLNLTRLRLHFLNEQSTNLHFVIVDSLKSQLIKVHESNSMF